MIIHRQSYPSVKKHNTIQGKILGEGFVTDEKNNLTVFVTRIEVFS